MPNWSKFLKDFGPEVDDGLDIRLSSAIEYLTTSPPDIQKFVRGKPKFVDATLHGATVGERALRAAKIVRNNLFHGGKFTPHTSPERDAKLMLASLTVLERCLALDPELRFEFEHQII